MPNTNPSYIAGEDLAPATIVKFEASGVDNQVVAADDGDEPLVGIVHNGSRMAPIPEVTTVLAAKEGETVMVYGIGDTCEVKVGAAALDAGDLIMADANGLAIAATTGKYYIARALIDAAAGAMCNVQVMPGQLD
jgi:hypothetical protein